jgi:hypothetical protein
MSLVLNSIPLGGGYFMLLYTYLISDGVMFKVLLFMGRFLTGIGIGWSCLTAPVREHAHFTCLCLGQNEGRMQSSIGAIFLCHCVQITLYRFHSLKSLDVQLGGGVPSCFPLFTWLWSQMKALSKSFPHQSRWDYSFIILEKLLKISRADSIHFTFYKFPCT